MFKKAKKIRRTYIGGQAVMEGVMMRGRASMATAVRADDGNIYMESERFVPNEEKNKFYSLPFIRGIVNFISMMVLGIKILMRSGAMFDNDENSPSKFEIWMSKKLKISPLTVAIIIGMLTGFLFAFGLFVFLPNVITTHIFTNINAYSFYKNLTEGAIRLSIFILYVALVGLIPNIKRVFRYHGAEHKTISCYEHGLDLTVENVAKMTTVHDRCGTTFMFIVMVVGTLLISITGWIDISNNRMLNILFRIAIRLAMLPIVTSISYEILKFLAKFDNYFVNILKLPGLALQKLTTREPDNGMIECAIAAFNKVYEMENDKNVACEKFNLKLNYKSTRKKLENEHAQIDKSDIDWMLCDILKIKRSDLENLIYLREHDLERLIEYIKKRESGISLNRIIGKTVFYGYEINVNRRVLDPRMETEELIPEILKVASTMKRPRILDLCTGSGAIAIALKKESADIDIYASDISEYAIDVARENARINNAEVTFIKSNMFENIAEDLSFDIIVSNPPYIKSAEIKNLDKVVRCGDPKIALDGGSDGLKYYRKIKEYFDKNTTRYLFLEIASDQADDISTMFSEYNVEIKKDINGNDRIALIRR